MALALMQVVQEHPTECWARCEGATLGENQDKLHEGEEILSAPLANITAFAGVWFHLWCAVDLCGDQ